MNLTYIGDPHLLEARLIRARPIREQPASEATATPEPTAAPTAFEIGGHTDSQGSESGNLRLSAERAEAVLATLRAQGLAMPGSVAKGFGEADPIADNATADGFRIRKMRNGGIK